jgi:hypothetical protein
MEVKIVFPMSQNTLAIAEVHTKHNILYIYIRFSTDREPVGSHNFMLSGEDGRFAIPVGVGRDNATLTEPGLSHETV